MCHMWLARKEMSWIDHTSPGWTAGSRGRQEERRAHRILMRLVCPWCLAFPEGKQDAHGQTAPDVLTSALWTGGWVGRAEVQ